MLTSAPTKHGAGITLYGDFLDLDTLYHTIHKIAEEGSAEEHTRDFLLGLAYDVRKAKEKKREMKKLGVAREDSARYKGVSILWPYVIPQVAMLRRYAGYRTTDHRDQACLYLLEDCVITSLLAFDPTVGKPCVEFFLRCPSFPNDYLFEFCNECARRYIEIPGKRRFHELPVLLKSMWWMSEEYQAFAKHVQTEAETQSCSPHDLGDRRDWPDFEW